MSKAPGSNSQAVNELCYNQAFAVVLVQHESLLLILVWVHNLLKYGLIIFLSVPVDYFYHVGRTIYLPSISFCCPFNTSIPCLIL